jgi:hypothetical protein
MRRILFYGRLIEWLDYHPNLRPYRVWTRLFVWCDAKQQEAYDRYYV